MQSSVDAPPRIGSGGPCGTADHVDALRATTLSAEPARVAVAAVRESMVCGGQRERVMIARADDTCRFDRIQLERDDVQGCSALLPDRVLCRARRYTLLPQIGCSV